MNKNSLADGASRAAARIEQAFDAVLRDAGVVSTKHSARDDAKQSVKFRRLLKSIILEELAK